jgi:chitinase
VVKIGRFDLSQIFERGSVVSYPSEIVIHPEWKSWTKNFDSDIALILLEQKIQISDAIFPICLSSKTVEAPKESNGIIVGWGKREGSPKSEDKPRQLEVTIRTNEECFLKNPRFAAISSRNTFCAGKDETSGPCNGDSGSGLFFKASGRSLRWFLKGIISASFITNDGVCDVSDDAIFTNVLNYIEWINEVALSKNVILPQSSVVLQPPPSVSTSLGDKSKIFNKEIFCFFESWAMGRPGDGSYSLYDFKPELCTTAVYMLAELDVDKLKPLSPSLELTDNGGQNLYRRFTGLKQKHPHLRTLLAIGGWVEGSVKYSQLAADSNKRKRFARNSAEYLKKYGFDGLHFHWEHPAHRGGLAEDKQNFVLLLKEIHDVYKPQNLYVSAFLRVQKADVEKAYDIKNIAKFVDSITMMTFDFNAQWNQRVGFPASITGDGDDNVDSRVNFFIGLGAPAEKLIVGIPFFGRSFITDNNGNIGESSRPSGFAGPFVGENGFLGYNEICRMRKESEWDEIKFDFEKSQSIGKFKKDGLQHVVIFDSPRSVANKVKYVHEKNLGGVWTWFVDTGENENQKKI